jgi:hypothetical protein
MVRHRLVCAKVADSAYASVPAMIAATAVKMKVPSIFSGALVWFLKKKISALANFDLANISPLKVAAMSDNVPVVLCHASDDEFIPIRQSEEIFRAYACAQKKFVSIVGGHNGQRSIEFITSACAFVIERLGKAVPAGYRAVRLAGFSDADDHFRSYDALLRAVAEPGDAPQAAASDGSESAWTADAIGDG